MVLSFFKFRYLTYTSTIVCQSLFREATPDIITAWTLVRLKPVEAIHWSYRFSSMLRHSQSNWSEYKKLLSQVVPVFPDIAAATEMSGDGLMWLLLLYDSSWVISTVYDGKTMKPLKIAKTAHLEWYYRTLHHFELNGYILAVADTERAFSQSFRTRQLKIQF